MDHAPDCPGRPDAKGICCAPCPVAEAKREDGIQLILQQLRSQGVASATVSDGTMFFFTRAVVEELWSKFQADPKLEQVHLMLFSDPKKAAAARAKVAGAC